MAALAISNLLCEGLFVVSPSVELTVGEAELLRAGPVEPPSADSLARLWSGISPVTAGVPFDLAEGYILSPLAEFVLSVAEGLRMYLSKGHFSS